MLSCEKIYSRKLEKLSLANVMKYLINFVSKELSNKFIELRNKSMIKLYYFIPLSYLY